MGLNISSLNNLKQNQYLNKLVSNQHISTDASNDDFWKQLLSFAFDNLPQMCNEQKFFDENVAPLLSTLIENNLTSHNIGSIVRIVINKTSQLKEEESDQQNYNLIVWQTYNALFILRSAAKYLIETLTEDNIIRHFVAIVDSNDTKSDKNEESGLVIIEQLLNALIEILVDIPLSDMTYNLQLEAINGLLVLLSTQMYSARPANKSSIYRLVMQKKCAIHALLLTKSLLTNFVAQRPAPEFQSGSIILGLASGLWNVLTLGYGKGGDSDKPAFLARQSLLLLLVLTNHCTTEVNPYREALFSCCDSQLESKTATDQTVTGFKIDFTKLYKTLCVNLNDDQTTLLLYMLLHRNHYFKSFVLSRALELDQLVIPILKILYTSPDRNSHHIYMALIILLVLSEDNLFNESIHDITLKSIVWYTDRQLTEISLGGLIILIVIRTIQYNMSRSRDRFLHTNLCATLANMSNHFKRLSPYVSQRLVSLFEKLSKKFNKILEEIQTNDNKTSNGVVQSDASSDCETNSVVPDVVQDVSIFEEVLRMLLEIINACLAAQLTNNPNLVYTLLYKRQVLEPFHSHPCFQDIVMNIETVLTYFSNRIESVDRNLSVAEVYEIIQQSSLQWPSDRLKKFPELRFRYVEDEQPEEFFIPYIWSLVFRSSHIYWNSQNILLFNPYRNN